MHVNIFSPTLFIKLYLILFILKALKLQQHMCWFLCVWNINFIFLYKLRKNLGIKLTKINKFFALYGQFID